VNASVKTTWSEFGTGRVASGKVFTKGESPAIRCHVELGFCALAEVPRRNIAVLTKTRELTISGEADKSAINHGSDSRPKLECNFMQNNQVLTWSTNCLKREILFDL
jgi:hypothetical protein